jgi:hypothetical protein
MIDRLLDTASQIAAEAVASAAAKNVLIAGAVVTAAAVNAAAVIVVYEYGKPACQAVYDVASDACSWVGDTVSGWFAAPPKPILVNAQGVAFLPGVEMALAS